MPDVFYRVLNKDDDDDERLRTRVKPVCQTEIANHFNIWALMKLENYLVRQKYIPKIQYLFNYLSV